MGKDKDKVKLEGVLETREVVAYLEDVLAGFRAGSVCMTVGEECLTLRPRGMMELSLKASRKKETEKFSLEIAWRRVEEACLRPAGPDEAA
ncbi:hypothetical protein NNJEOMEG_01940 [Fundidesulfovibrio magnetotacticus]|uniref:Amphi-Trp domain-containing protein n=1 Tax=Fundidesulfovibrio magnetotacticus TaxID=2730080 RepID=A0A6V8LU39_9BACT|nr:amphi-Trp domain-containing protein [Fundidesulfovibrio magnetotacticus]GFK94101.1 hypothetical protein NNJEOMEG_01940 [Fundidesulfovibrio magnetotacticus]